MQDIGALQLLVNKLDSSRTYSYADVMKGTRAQIASGNILTLSISGLAKDVNIQFPSRRLPVCYKCKRNYKTRQFCRVKKMHKHLPWCKTYLCVTLDESCVSTENNVVGEALKAKTTSWKPYKFKDSVEMNCDFPTCTDCKKKNYTGSYCRERRNAHRYLPWGTVYVNLSPLHSPSSPNKVISNNISDSQRGSEECSVKVSSTSSSCNTEDGLKHSTKECAADDIKKKYNITDGTNQHICGDDSINILSSHLTVDMDNFGSKRKRQEESLDKNDKCKDDDTIRMNGDGTFKKIDKSRTFFLEISHELYKMQWLDFDKNKADALEEDEVNIPVRNDRNEVSQNAVNHEFDKERSYNFQKYPHQQQRPRTDYSPYLNYPNWNQMNHNNFPPQSHHPFVNEWHSTPHWDGTTPSNYIPVYMPPTPVRHAEPFRHRNDYNDQNPSISCWNQDQRSQAREFNPHDNIQEENRNYNMHGKSEMNYYGRGELFNDVAKSSSRIMSPLPYSDNSASYLQYPRSFEK